MSISLLFKCFQRDVSILKSAKICGESFQRHLCQQDFSHQPLLGRCAECQGLAESDLVENEEPAEIARAWKLLPPHVHDFGIFPSRNWRGYPLAIQQNYGTSPFLMGQLTRNCHFRVKPNDRSWNAKDLNFSTSAVAYQAEAEEAQWSAHVDICA